MPHFPPGRRLRAVALLVWATLLGVAHTGATAAAAPSEPSADLTWGIQPAAADGAATRPSFAYTLDPGALVEDAVRITNFSDVEVTLRISSHDAFNTASGGFDVLTAVVDSIDVGSWITLATDELTIPARGQIDVPFRTTVPSNATPGDHAGGIVASMLVERVQPDGSTVAVDNRVGARVYVRVTGPERPALVVSALETRFDGEGVLGTGGAVTVTYTVRNTGNMRLAGEQELVASGLFGIGRREVALGPIPELLPGGEFADTVTIDGVRPLGRLTAKVELRPSEPALERVSASASQWAVPWRALALLAAAMVFVVWRRRHDATAAPVAVETPEETPATSRPDATRTS